MRIVATTATGRIGAVLAPLLLDAGVEVVLPVRHPDKVAALAARGAIVVAGAQEDVAFMTRIARGADAMFWVTPPDYHAADFRAHQREYGVIAREIVVGAAVPRVVNLSAFGVHLASATGQIAGAGDVERELDAVPAVTHLRAAYFMDNFTWQVPAIARAHSIFMPMRPSARTPMVATADLARAAADRLLDAHWTGRSVVDLLGPEDLSFADATAQIAAGLGEPVTYVQIPEADSRAKALASGRVGASFADLQLEMFRAIDSGVMRADATRTPAASTSTPTTLAQYAREILAPMIRAARA